MFELYIDKAGEYRWRFKSSNGSVIAVSSEGYKSELARDRSIEILSEGFTLKSTALVPITASAAE